MKRRAPRFALLAVLLGAVLAILEGFDRLRCASTPDVLLVVAGSFGAGASLVAFLSRRRAG